MKIRFQIFEEKKRTEAAASVFLIGYRVFSQPIDQPVAGS